MKDEKLGRAGVSRGRGEGQVLPLLLQVLWQACSYAYIYLYSYFYFPILLLLLPQVGIEEEAHRQVMCFVIEKKDKRQK